MQPNTHDAERRAEQRAALRRLRRAQLAEARRIRQAVADTCLLTPARLRAPCRVAARGGPPGGDVPDAHAADLAPAHPQQGVPLRASAGCSATGTIRPGCMASP